MRTEAGRPRAQILLVPLLLLLAACSPDAAPDEQESVPTSIRLPMGFVPNVQYSPFYVAVERSYYREAGLEIEFDYSLETDGVALVGSNEVQFALASGEQVLLAREQGLPVVYVMAWFQDFPIAIAAPSESGIESPADLVGKDVGIVGLFGASYIGYRALLNAAGLPDDAAALDSIGFNQVEAMVAGQEDAVVVYANNEPLLLEAQGIPVNVIRVSDYVKLASNGLITNEVTISERPELVERMVGASLRGLRDTISDPDAAYELSKIVVAGLEEADQSVQRRVLEASIEMWRAEPLGAADPAAWENMQRVLLDMGLLTQAGDVRSAFTNRFVLSQ